MGGRALCVRSVVSADPGRVDDITKVKGVLIAPSAIEEVVRGIKGLGDEYEVVVDKTGDSETIRKMLEINVSDLIELCGIDPGDS
jgi:phenylacetate-coenzyme A ligase PaaK-like adenylate-forming protein